MINFLKRPRIIILLVILIGGIIISYAFFGRDKAPAYDFIIIEKRNLIQEISVTGRVQSAESVDLAFEKSGKVSRVYVNIGDRVNVWQTLVVLENSETTAQLAQAQAGTESARAKLLQYEAALVKEQAKLAELKGGTRPEEIQVQEVKVANAKTALEDAKRNLVDKLEDAYTKSDDAVRNKVDQFFNNPRSSNPQLSSKINTDFQLERDIEWQRFLLQDTFTSWRSSLDQLTTSSDITSYIFQGEINLNQIKLFLDKAALIINSLTSHLDLSQATIDAWKTDVSTGRININTAITNLSTAKEKLSTEESDLALAEQELILKKAGIIEEQITAQEAQVKQSEADITSQEAKIKEAEANAQYYRAQISKTVIRAPISGIVTIQDAKIGEIISANTIIVSLISEVKFEIKASVPEADIAKVSVGNTSIVTLDAYGRDVVFEAKVVAIDPAETIVDGVATYKVTFQFIEDDERIKSGMTANIDITSDNRENVIAVPQRSIIRKNGDKFVRILDGNNVKEIKVETGLYGSDGNIEIIRGINEGDKVITFIEE
mgnify:CR=1 FL=1|tara:strand:+ start:477 stop:2117 length:1641 start_codon:yes stop_codon:yes gene_type:complete